MPSLIFPATILLVISTIGGGLDLFYLHLHKYKLFSRADSAYEHRLHTLQTILFSIVVFLLICRNHEGLLLFAAVVFVAADLATEILDILSEKQSRAALGGLSTVEYLLHVLMSGTKIGFVVLALASKPATAWQISSPSISSVEYPLVVRVIGWSVFAVGLISAAVHLWLQQSRYRSQS